MLMQQGDLEEVRNLILDLQQRGFRLQSSGNLLHVTPGERLTTAEVESLRRLKHHILQTLPHIDRIDSIDRLTAQPWTLAEADRLVASVLPAWDSPDRSPELHPLAEAIDNAYLALAEDLQTLRQAVAAFQGVASGAVRKEGTT
jgi:hypothetical protein